MVFNSGILPNIGCDRLSGQAAFFISEFLCLLHKFSDKNKEKKNFQAFKKMHPADVIHL